MLRFGEHILPLTLQTSSRLEAFEANRDLTRSGKHVQLIGKKPFCFDGVTSGVTNPFVAVGNQDGDVFLGVIPFFPQNL